MERILGILGILGILLIRGKNHLDPQQHEASRFWFRPTVGSLFLLQQLNFELIQKSEENMKINQKFSEF